MFASLDAPRREIGAHVARPLRDTFLGVFGSAVVFERAGPAAPGSCEAAVVALSVLGLATVAGSLQIPDRRVAMEAVGGTLFATGLAAIGAGLPLSF